MSDNISETKIVTMEDKQEAIGGLSNYAIISVLKHGRRNPACGVQCIPAFGACGGTEVHRHLDVNISLCHLQIRIIVIFHQIFAAPEGNAALQPFDILRYTNALTPLF